MAHILGRLSRRPRLLLTVLAGVFGAGLLLAFAGRGAGQTEQSLMSHRVQEGRFELTQSFAGRIAPGEQIEVLSGADATVTAINFSFGDRVEQGQVLYRLDDSDVWRKQAEARIGYLQAADAAAKLEGWNTGPEMRRAERAVEAASVQLDDARRRRDEAERLFEKGLIARTEMEGLETSYRQARQGLEVAQDDRALTHARGMGTDRQVAQLQRGLAGDRLQGAGGQDDAVIAAPRSGIMVRAASRALGDSKSVTVGAKVNQGQSMGVIAALDSLDVVFRVDEADLALMERGAVATIRGPGFANETLKGHVLSVAGEAEAAPGSDRTLFEARVRLSDMSPQAVERVRIGMTAQVRVVLYEAPRALSVPVAALVRGTPKVRVRRTDGRIEERSITLGRIGPDHAEVLGGLRAGEEVVWDPAASA